MHTSPCFSLYMYRKIAVDQPEMHSASKFCCGLTTHIFVVSAPCLLLNYLNTHTFFFLQNRVYSVVQEKNKECSLRKGRKHAEDTGQT